MFVAFASLRQDRVTARAESWTAHLPKGASVVRPDPHFAAAFTSNLSCSPCVVGDVWLDDRSTGRPGTALGGKQAIDFVGRQYGKDGVGGLAALTGEFSFVLWDPLQRAAFAIRDPFGIRPLFTATAEGDVLISDEADRIGAGNGFDLHFIAEFLATGHQSARRTIWRGTNPLQPGTVMVWQEARTTTKRLWTLSMVPRPHADREEVANEVRRLITSAVQCHLSAGRGVCADLSGGVDSSSVVCTAAGLARRGSEAALHGTITFEDSLGGHESDFVNDVLKAYPELHHSKVIDTYPWQEDGEPPPQTPQPERDFPFYARDRMVAKTLSRAGADVLLSGVGPDCYLSIGVGHATDMVWHGRIGPAVRELATWSRRARMNFWATILDEVVVPLAPAKLRHAYLASHVTFSKMDSINVRS